MAVVVSRARHAGVRGVSRSCVLIHNSLVMARQQLVAMRLLIVLAACGGACVAAPPAAEVAQPPAVATPVPPDSATPTPSPEQVAGAPVLNLSELEQRLRETRAIGLFTKLSLKNQVDDLLAQFKAFHERHSRITLEQLRQRYELLLMKVVSLLQDGDPKLASAVFSSREAIWVVLTDPKTFTAA